MAKVEIYYWPHCPFCRRALDLLAAKGVGYTGYDLTGDEAGRDKMAARTGGPKSMPQIFINDRHIGGSDDLHRLEADGALETLLNG